MKTLSIRLVVIVLAIALAAVLTYIVYIKINYGGGQPYPDVSTPPSVDPANFDSAIMLNYPPGWITSSVDGRLFYSYRTLDRPERFTNASLFEWTNGKSIPFPDLKHQPLFNGAMGITTDRQSRLWIIIPGGPTNTQTRLLAININSRKLVFDYHFPPDFALFAQDMRISPDGNTVYLANAGLLDFIAAEIIVLDLKTRTARALLQGHPSVTAQHWYIRRQDGGAFRLMAGLVTFSIGVDGIALSDDGQWLYYAAMNHDSAYRIHTQYLLNADLSDDLVKQKVQRVGPKPLSDGLELDAHNNLIIADVENGGLAKLTPDGTLTTLVKTDYINWADSITIMPDGTIYFTDSRLTHLPDTMSAPLSDLKAIKAAAPYHIYKITHHQRNQCK